MEELTAMVDAAMAKEKYAAKSAEVETAAGELVVMMEAAMVEAGMAWTEVKMVVVMRTEVEWAVMVGAAMVKVKHVVMRVEV